MARKRLEWLGISFLAAGFSGGVEALVFSWRFHYCRLVEADPFDMFGYAHHAIGLMQF